MFSHFDKKRPDKCNLFGIEVQQVNRALFSARQWYVPLSAAEASRMRSSLRVSPPPSADTRSRRVMRGLPATEGPAAGRLWYADCEGCSDSGGGGQF